MRILAFLLPAVLAATSSAQQVDYPGFVRAFDQARRAGDWAGMARAIRSAPDLAVQHLSALCWDLRRRPEDRSASSAIESMKVAWQEAFDGSSTVATVEAFVRDQPLESLARIQQADRELGRLLSEAAAAEVDGGREALVAVGDKAAQIGQRLEQLGDLQKAAKAWRMASRARSVIPDRSLEDQTSMIQALQRFVALRESWGLIHDAAYAQNVDFLRIETRRLAIMQIEEEEPVPYLDTLLMAGVEEQVQPLRFEMQDELESDVFVYGGPVPTLWASVEQKRATPEKLPLFRNGDLYVLRLAGQRFAVSTDAGADAARRATPVEAQARPVASRFHLDAERRHPYAMWFFVGGTEEPFMQTEINILPTRERALVYYRSAASWRTEIAGEQVAFYDDSCDGRLFAPNPFEQGIYLRILGKPDKTGIPVPAYDSMRVGRGARIPYSELVRIGGDWYRLRGIDDGSSVGIRPIDPSALQTGTVELDWRGSRRARPELLIIHGRQGLESTAFDIAAGKPVEVPAGEYEIGFGRIVVGSGSRTQMAQIFKGDSPPFVVSPGERYTLRMGEPFHIDFGLERNGRQIAIDSSTFRVIDVSGAQYANLHGAVLAPDVVASPDADGRGAKVYGGFIPVVDPDLALVFAERSPLLQLSAIGFPRPRQSQGQAGELVLRLELPGEGMVVGLRQDRHSLFGKLDPDYR